LVNVYTAQQNIPYVEGIWLHECGAIGASPDGIVMVPPNEQCPVAFHDDRSAHAVPGIIEVKCPYAAREKTIAEAAQTISGFALGRNNVYAFCR